MKVSECKPTDMFDYLKPYRYILLTGPHRAGTTIAALMIANDLAIEHYEEEDVLHWAQKNEPEGIDLREFFAEKDNERMVLRCPAFSHAVHNYVDVPNLAVIMLMRPLHEIKTSQERVLWGYGKPQMKYYPGYDPPVALAKYNYWFDVQEGVLGDRGFILEYHNLSDHPMWIPKEKRAEFHVRQHKEDDPRGPRHQLLPHEYNRVRQY